MHESVENSNKSKALKLSNIIKGKEDLIFLRSLLNANYLYKRKAKRNLCITGSALLLQLSVSFLPKALLFEGNKYKELYESYEELVKLGCIDEDVVNLGYCRSSEVLACDAQGEKPYLDKILAFCPEYTTVMKQISTMQYINLMFSSPASCMLIMYLDHYQKAAKEEQTLKAKINDYFSEHKIKKCDDLFVAITRVYSAFTDGYRLVEGQYITILPKDIIKKILIEAFFNDFQALYKNTLQNHNANVNELLFEIFIDDAINVEEKYSKNNKLSYKFYSLLENFSLSKVSKPSTINKSKEHEIQMV